MQQSIAPEVKDAITQLTRAVLCVRPLLDVLKGSVHVSLDRKESRDFATLKQLLDRVATWVGVPQLIMSPSIAVSDLTIFEQVVSNRLFLDGWHESPQNMIATSSEVDQVCEAVIKADFDYRYRRTNAISFDGTPLKVYSAGVRCETAVVIVSACGMPAKLCEHWMHFLGNDYFVVTWESRGLFLETQDFDGVAHDLSAQAEDLFAVMDHFGVKVAHLMGLCGGAAIALRAAAAQPPRVASLSLWHGDFELGTDSPKTNHQHNLKALMAMAAESRESAACLRNVFSQSMDINNIRPDLAPLILYPYATDELLFRYGKLNGSIMSTDLSDQLDGILQPALIVTSDDDVTADPAASKLLAARLPNAQLCVEPHGDHISLFDAAPAVTHLAARFLSQEALESTR